MKIMKKTEIAGIILVILGAFLLAGYPLYLFVQSPGIPAIVRLGVVALFAGFLVILLSLVRERFMDVRKEKQK